MKTSMSFFSNEIKLPCTVSCGADGPRTFSGTAIKIEPESMVLRLAPASPPFPRVGDKVKLEVHLPVNPEMASAKDLSISGLIVSMVEMPDGVRQFVLNFRRAHFKDRGSNGRSTNAKKASQKAKAVEM
jgi:hypothetical protein